MPGSVEVPRRIQATAAAVFALLAALYLGPLALRLPLLDPDEGLHAAIAQEMVERGDWVTPRLFGEAFLDKPILYFWTQAASLSLGGMNEISVRLPGALFGLLGSLTTGLLAWRMVDARLGVLAALLHGSMILPVALAQAAVHDVALVPSVNLALLCWWLALRSSAARRWWCHTLLAGLCLGLAILTKGLVGVALAGLAYATLVTWERRWSWRVLLGLCVAGLLALLVALPWYVLMEQRNPGYLYYYFVERHLLGYVTHGQRHGGRPLWYYAPLFIGGAIPWGLYLPVLLRERWLAFRAARQAPKPFEQSASHAPTPDALPAQHPSAVVPLAGCWLISGLVFLSLASSKLVTYLLPLFPPTALLAADLWRRWIDGRLAAPLARGMGRVLVAECLVGPFLLPAVMLGAARILQVRFTPLEWSIAALVSLATLAPLAAHCRRQWRQGLGAAVAAMGLVCATVMTQLMPGLAAALSSRDVAQAINAQGKLPGQVLVVEERIGSLVFYLAPELRRRLQAGQIRTLMWHDLRALASLPGDAWVLLPDKRLRRAGEHLDLSAPGWRRLGHFRQYPGPAALAVRLDPLEPKAAAVVARPR